MSMRLNRTVTFAVCDTAIHCKLLIRHVQERLERGGSTHTTLEAEPLCVVEGKTSM
jgi:hypothetical protein